MGKTMSTRLPPEEPKTKFDPFWKFREGSALAWIVIGLLLLGIIFGAAAALYPDQSPVQFTQIPGERFPMQPVLE